MASYITTKNQKNPQKKQKQMQQVVVKEERRKASASTLAYAQYLVAPYDAPSIAPAPSPVPVRETTVRHNLVVDLAQNNNNNGQFAIEVRPHLSDTLSVTTSAADNSDQQGYAYAGGVNGVGSTAKYIPGQITHLSTGVQGGPINVTDASGGKVLAVKMNGSGHNSTWTVVLNIRGGAAAKLQFNMLALPVGGNWTSIASTIINQNLGRSTTNLTVTIPVGCAAIALSLAQSSYAYGVNLQVTATFTYSSGTGTMGLWQTVATQKTYGLNLAGNIDDLNHWRVTAQDLLITYEGDTLNDGGSLASARVPSDWSGGANDPYGNPYSDILALPYDRYDGPLKEGTHVHWIPGDVDDLSPINSVGEELDFGYFKIVAAGTMTHSSASVRVRVCTTIAYYSTNPDYGEMQWAPPPTDLGLLLQYVARVIPAATSNDKHIIQKLAAFAGKHASNGIEYLINNPAQLTALAKMALALLA